jgi:hypothetical protein
MNTIKCSRLNSKNPGCPAASIRFLNAYPCELAVDIYVNGALLKADLAYQQFTDYYSVPPCLYHIEVYPSGKGKHDNCPIADVCLNIGPRCAMTIAIVCSGSGLLGIQEIFDPCTRIRNRCKAYVRFINLSPNSPPLDVYIAGGTQLFSNVAYTAHTRYVPVDPGTYVLQLRPAGTGLPGLTMAPAEFGRCTLSTVYAVGYAGGTPPLETVVSTDGNF